MSKVRAMLSYPDIMRKKILEKGMDWYGKGGEFESFAAAVEEAQRVAEEKNFPIQVKAMGKKMTVYPSSLNY